MIQKEVTTSKLVIVAVLCVFAPLRCTTAQSSKIYHNVFVVHFREKIQLI